MNSAKTEPICPKCSGTGWEIVKADGTSMVRRCQCYLLEHRLRMYKEARVPARFRACRLENFDVYEEGSRRRKINLSLSKALGTAQGFTQNYPGVSKGLLFMGPYGVGKTHLAVAVLTELCLKKGVSCLFYDFMDLLKEIKASYDSASRTSEFSILGSVITKEVLLLDDLGAHKVTDWVQDILAYIINKRYNEKKITIITSNWLDKPQTEDEDTLTDRIGYRPRSRISEMCHIIELSGRDYRTRKSSQL